MEKNKLFYGDNLDILKRYVKDESIDLIYLDPPFNSNQDYNVLFAEQNGKESAAQIKAFDDTWHWGPEAELSYQEAVLKGGKLSEVMQSFRKFLGENDMMAYLSMMATRLQELHRILKPTGSIYLHCDTTASHYLKILMDAIFNAANFKNEISWKRSTTKSDFRQGATNWPRVHDVILYYVKDNTKALFNQQFTPYTEEYINDFYKYADTDGRKYALDKLTAPGSGSRGHPQYELMGVTRYWVYNKEKMEQLINEGRIIQTNPGTVPRYKRYLDEVLGVAVSDFWQDINPLQFQSVERMGYPTQKPEALLERIIQAGSNDGGVVLDPFCGCGTTIIASQKLNRKWVGIDITFLSISLMKHRLITSFGQEVMANIETLGEPTALPEAEQLAIENPYQFQWWILGFVGARPVEQKKGADKGIDGRLYFYDSPTRLASGQTSQILFSVKAGKVNVSHIRDLRGVLEREKAAIGIFLSLNPPTRDMVAEAATAGFYTPIGVEAKKYMKIQILTAEELLNGKKPDFPPFVKAGGDVTFKKAPRKAVAKKSGPKQTKLES